MPASRFNRRIIVAVAIVGGAVLGVLASQRVHDGSDRAEFIRSGQDSCVAKMTADEADSSIKVGLAKMTSFCGCAMTGISQRLTDADIAHVDPASPPPAFARAMDEMVQACRPRLE